MLKSHNPGRLTTNDCGFYHPYLLKHPTLPLSSKVGSIVQFICLIMPYIAPLCKGLLTYPTDLPWQMKSTRIIKISYHKMPSNAEFCVGLSAFYGIVFFLFITTLFYNSIIRFTVFPSHKPCFLRSFPVAI